MTDKSWRHCFCVRFTVRVYPLAFPPSRRGQLRAQRARTSHSLLTRIPVDLSVCRQARDSQDPSLVKPGGNRHAAHSRIGLTRLLRASAIRILYKAAEFGESSILMIFSEMLSSLLQCLTEALEPGVQRQSQHTQHTALLRTVTTEAVAQIGKITPAATVRHVDAPSGIFLLKPGAKEGADGAQNHNPNGALSRPRARWVLVTARNPL